MALTGKVAHTVVIKYLDPLTQEWPETFDDLDDLFFCGQGFELPENQDWINNPAGTSSRPVVITFPRSAENEPVEPPPGGLGWIVKEC